MGQGRVLLGISLFWLALSMVFDGINTLVLPRHLLGLGDEGSKATILGLVSFVGLVAAMLVQPVAGAFSDRLRPRWGPTRHAGAGCTRAADRARPVRAVDQSARGAVAASTAQAAQQGFLPDLVSPASRGIAAGFKLSMDIGGALLGFLVLGRLLASDSSGPALGAIGAVVVVACVLALPLVREPCSSSEAPGSPVGLWDAFRLDLRRHRAFAWLVISRFLFLLGTYVVGRFLLFFVGDRLGLEPGRAASEAGSLLAALTLLTVLLAPPAGWASDRFGRLPLMLLGAVLSAVGALLLIAAGTSTHIVLFGGLMAVGSATLASANWALIADLAPSGEAERFYALANGGTAGAAAAAGLFGALVDWGNASTAGLGYALLFGASAVAFISSAVPLRGTVAPVAGSALVRVEVG